ncbi:MAG: DUF4255 domain-containing protein [Chloroflexi bacterium]|nr:DUF4255 domain-containing protein [Chloroflexota bacterium]
MATYQAITATSEAIRGLLESAAADSEFAGTRFELYQASDFQTAADGVVSLYLYKVGVNTTRRNLPPRLGPDGRRYRPSLPLDLSYMLTPWAKKAEMQQRLLGWCVRVLEDTPLLPAGLLNYHSAEPDIFASNETVELTLEVLTLQDWVNIWQIAQANQQASVTYLARIVAVDSNVPMPEAGPVQTREFDIVKAAPK